MNNVAPGMTASLGRNRPMTWSALTLRSASGLRVTNIRPLLYAVLPPAKAMTVFTAGSFMTMVTNCVTFCFIA